MSKYKKHLIAATLTAILTALTVVISRFLSVNIWNMSIGFSFIPLMLCGMLAGPLWGGVCGALADFIGAMLFPFGPYFPGFTAVAFLSGALFGVVGISGKRIKKDVNFIAVAAGIILIKELVCSLLLNTLWISLLYGSAFEAVFISRLPLSAVTVVLEIIFAIVVRASILPAVNKVKERL